MTLEYFKRRMKYDFAFYDITDQVTLFVEKKFVEIYDYRDKSSRRYPSIDDVLDVEVDGKKIRDIIEAREDFPPLIFYNAM